MNSHTPEPMFKFTLFLLLSCLCGQLTLSAKTINVLVWDERQDKQKPVYDNWLGNEIVTQLDAVTDNLNFRSVALDDPEHGLSNENLKWADVVLWWGHVRHSDVSWAKAKEVAELVRKGELNLVILHSAHWARPFVELMNQRAIEEGLAYIQKHNPGKKITYETVSPPKERSAPMRGSVFTPAYYGYKKGKTAVHGIIHLPWCCFPDWRNTGEPSTLRVTQQDHPLTNGIPNRITIPVTEMYNEPFHIPEPDEVIFEETWETGERFRSGVLWNIGEGKLFYFRPGHETFPVFKQKEIIQILDNACQWLGAH
ncbi:ThuA domain-containing protein [Opitutia bacterium ISCC 51]|nr:ThuA domain-containing protein [Opitutae bacterium ISCC 51]QXD28506.1 ThuA domain-containing protein [Opitutae bacterium ISCC 52]